MRRIIILPAPNCRRSRKIMQYLERHHIPYRRVELASPEGEALAAQYDLCASPGIIVDGVSVNPFDLRLPAECRVDEERANATFVGASANQDGR